MYLLIGFKSDLWYFYDFFFVFFGENVVGFICIGFICEYVIVYVILEMVLGNI